MNKDNNIITIEELKKIDLNFFSSVTLNSATYFDVAVDIPKSANIIKKYNLPK